ncbi:class I SAM-dependent methyltransferase [Sphingomonas bacterium]|uniref:class I SAM-dependent methyltransferase n=1 Tax=Sphingomonas bacterium TaxID=1895847 RepID=UPI001575C718|nr:class I SAM-dependent methyltransferase [Sphingomonas bacterium]
MIRIPSASLFAALLLCTVPGIAGARTSPAIAAAVADPTRPDADRVRDANRKPAEVLAFAGVRPGMVVAELGSGGGYYTRLLAKAVGPRGKVYAIVTAAQAARPNGLAALSTITAAYPNVSIVSVPDYAHLTLAAKADLFWTTENYHDFHNGPTANIAAMDHAVYDALKPGGIFYVEDHSAAPGAGLAVTSTVHRMDEDVAKQELTAAGFKLAAEGDLLRNPSDNRAGSNSETGHFATDRFMLRMKK